MPGPVPGLGGPSLRFFRSEVCQFVVNVVVVSVVVGVIVFVVDVVDVIVVLVVALTVPDWGSVTVTASAGLWGHRGMVAVLAGV